MKRARPSIAELRTQSSLTVPEAMIVTGYGRKQLVKLCENGELRHFTHEGASQMRIITASIDEYESRRAEIAS